MYRQYVIVPAELLQYASPLHHAGRSVKDRLEREEKGAQGSEVANFLCVRDRAEQWVIARLDSPG